MDPMFWPLLLLALGLALLVIELFVPSAGVLTVVACVSFVGAIGLGFRVSAQYGTAMLVVLAFLVPAFISIAVKWWPHTPFGRLILIQRPEHPDEVLPDTEEYRELPALVGQTGQAKTKMLPSGTVVLGDRKYDAVSDGMAIESGETIQVVDIRTNRIVVRPVDAELPQTETAPSADDILSQPIDSLGLNDIEQ